MNHIRDNVPAYVTYLLYVQTQVNRYLTDSVVVSGSVVAFFLGYVYFGVQNLFTFLLRFLKPL